MRNVVRMLCAVPATLVVVACGTSGQPEAGQPGSTPQEEQTFTQTVVKLHADGTQEVRQNQMTAAQMRQYYQRPIPGQRLPESLSEDLPYCTNQADITLWDSSIYNAGNMICFYNLGGSLANVYLPNYVRYVHNFQFVYWSGQAIGSWQTGSEVASLDYSGANDCEYDCTHFPCFCFETVNFPQYKNGCAEFTDAGGSCDYPAPSNIGSTMNYLWLNYTTSSTLLCSGCSTP